MAIRTVIAVAAIFVAMLGSVVSVFAADARTVRVGILKFGTVSWQLDVIRRYNIDTDLGFRIEPVELANGQATQVALQAGAVDIIINDFFWVSRQRGEGADWTFIPFSSALGAIEVPAGSPIHSIADLKGHTLGVAGTPIDRSWLMLRALAHKDYGFDVDAETTHPFAAAPLIAEQLRSGRADAVLTFWPSAAKLEALGMHRIISMNDVLEKLGVSPHLAVNGYIFSDKWAAANADLPRLFFEAIRRANQRLATDDGEWQKLFALSGAADQAELIHLRDAFRDGIPQHWSAQDREQAAKLYHLLGEIGGTAFVGNQPTLAPGTFSNAVSF
jgi:NitT/TauT family transport system substrate-binding protein